MRLLGGTSPLGVFQDSAGYRLEIIAFLRLPCIVFPNPASSTRVTRGLACNCAQRTRTRAYRFSGNTPAFPAQWLYGLLRALPGEAGSFATVAARIRPRNLTPASGVRTTRFRRTRRATLVSRSSRVHRISLHVRDDRERPSFAVRRAETITDLPDAESGIFLARALDAISTDLPVGQFGASWWQHIRCVPSPLTGEG